MLCNFSCDKKEYKSFFKSNNKFSIVKNFYSNEFSKRYIFFENIY